MGIKSSPLMDDLAGGRILVAEDEILIALDLSSMLTDAGAEVVGPATTLRAAKAIAQSDLLTAAILDVRLGRETTDSIAAILERQVPFVFYTGADSPADMQSRRPNSTVFVKPARQTVLFVAIAGSSTEIA